MSDSRLIIALDFPDADSAFAFVKPLSPEQCKLKVGLELYVAAGADFVRGLVDRGFDVFLDLKFHDIPNTVAAACRSAARLGVWMMNVHASGGAVMLQAAREAVDGFAQPPKLIAVTVLTSMDQTQLNSVGVSRDVKEQVYALASFTQEQGLDGIVCSAQEAQLLRKRFSQDNVSNNNHQFLLVTPGIRPEGSARGDQKRIMTPTRAIQAGSDYLVIGRPITQAQQPLMVINKINQEIAS